MSREFQPIIRVEGRTFAPPVPKTQPITAEATTPEPVALVEKTTINGISDKALQAAVERAEITYPTRSREVALEAIEAALPQLLADARAAGSLRITAVSEKAIEIAAEAIYSLHGSLWNEIGYRLRWIYKEDAEMILQAATPHIQLQSVFWDDLNEDLKDPVFAEEYNNAVTEIQKES